MNSPTLQTLMSEPLTSTIGQDHLPRYFTAVFDRLSLLRAGQLDLFLPDGRHFRAEGPLQGPQAQITIHSPELFARLLRQGELGFAEAYLDAEWSTPDLQVLLDLLLDASNVSLSDSFIATTALQLWERLRFWRHANSKRQARANIAAHYDLGNAFYQLWLDPSMTYSSALFTHPNDTLALAQERKYAALFKSLRLNAGEHLLEIGSGWGGFAEYAGKKGVRVTSLTLSQAQCNFARARIAAAGLSDQVTIKLQGYRQERGTYDGIASIEMFEAVGERYWPFYFNQIYSCLKPNRIAALQIITLHEDRWKSYRKSVDFIQKYIFPGGMLISQSRLREEIRNAGLSWRHSHDFGSSYSRTLRLWHRNFTQQWPEISHLGFDARFKRMWDFYLTSCASAFEHGHCDVSQITLVRP